MASNTSRRKISEPLKLSWPMAFLRELQAKMYDSTSPNSHQLSKFSKELENHISFVFLEKKLLVLECTVWVTPDARRHPSPPNAATHGPIDFLRQHPNLVDLFSRSLAFVAYLFPSSTTPFFCCEVCFWHENTFPWCIWALMMINLLALTFFSLFTIRNGFYSLGKIYLKPSSYIQQVTSFGRFSIKEPTHVDVSTREIFVPNTNWISFLAIGQVYVWLCERDMYKKIEIPITDDFNF